MAEKGETVAGETPLIKIITVASIGAGVQFGWALQLSLLTPYVQTLGVPHMWSSFIWLCGPLSGLIVQPIVGYSSDRCKSRFGRRRPFIATGGFLVAVAIFLIGFSKDLGYHAGDPLDQPFKPRAVVMFVVGFWLLDIANNMLQDPCRAFLADLSGNNHKKTRVAMGWYAFFMALGNTLGYAAGSYSGFYKIFTFTKTIACDSACANLKSVFIIDIVLLLLIVTLATTTVPEKLAGEANDHHTDGDEAQKRSAPFIGELISVIKSLKKPTWLLLLVTCINWIAWFPFLLYDTDWMGMEVYGGDVNGNAEEKRMYNIGVRAGAMGLMFNSIVQGFSALALEPLGRMLGGVQKVWGIVNIILAIGLGGTVWVSKVAEAWRHSHGSVVLPPPSNVVGGAWTIFALLGIPLSVTFSIPFALGSIYNKVDGAAGNGLTLGVINLAIVIPQVVVSVSAGRLDAAFGGGNLPAFVLGAIAALISALLAIFVLPSPPPQTQTVIVPAGGH